MDDVNRRFAPLTGHPKPCGHVRGVLMAVAQDLFIVLPDGAPQKTAVIDHLADAADLACEALTA